MKSLPSEEAFFLQDTGVLISIATCPAKDLWLGKMKNDWERLLFQNLEIRRHTAGKREILEEVKEFMADHKMLEDAIISGK